jgi:hypothetical protein
MRDIRIWYSVRKRSASRAALQLDEQVKADGRHAKEAPYIEYGASV